MNGITEVLEDDIVIINDFLTPSYHTHILNELDSSNYAWFYQSDITYQNTRESTPGDFGFANWITRDGINWSNAFYMPFCYKIKDILECSTIGRVRLDMTCYNPGGRIHEAHVDSEVPHYSAVYYVNDSDGDTIIYDQQFQGNPNPPLELTEKRRIDPKANRLLLFNGKYFHTGSSPAKNKNRIIINGNYFK